MIYKFKSKVSGDVVMLGGTGDHLLRLIGKQPAPQGIIEPPAMPTAIAALEQAVAEDEAARARDEAEAAAQGRKPAPRADAVSLRQRAWPLIEMLKRAQTAGKDVVWGV